MRLPHRPLAAALVAAILVSYATPVTGCGPFLTQPIFAFKESPDMPFDDFARGNIGIVRPTFGHKTLVIAYRYLNGGSFTGEEQQDLVDALNGIAPEQDPTEAIKAWVKARKEFVRDKEQPQIYNERPNGGYDFFPNCTANAFEVATETLKDRLANYGDQDINVWVWLDGQDTVFENCANGSHIPTTLSDASPAWLRKDRDYQIAAAYFYSLNFDKARMRFEQIAADADSAWSEVAAYLVGRTLVREASLTTDETKKREFYQQAENQLQVLIATGGKYANASRKLLALVKYHLRPEERFVELGELLRQGSDDNLRQDLIDYVWLLDKFKEQALKAEQERKNKLNQPAEEPKPAENDLARAQRETYEKIQRGELISIWIYPQTAEDSNERRSLLLYFNYDASESEILATFERSLARPLLPDEIKEIKEKHAEALATRLWNLSPNRRWESGAMSQYEGCDYECDELTSDLVPEVFRTTDLTDWIVTMQLSDPAAYTRAISRWHETRSSAWLVAALTKAEKNSPKLPRLLRAAEQVGSDEPSFPTIAYHIVRLKAALGQQDEARKLLDEMLTTRMAVLPRSTQNLFIEQRRLLAKDLHDFLRSAPRKPVSFFNEVGLGTIKQLMDREKSYYDPKYSGGQTQDQSDSEIESSYNHLLPWDDRVNFDERTADTINWHFSLQLLTEAARDKDLPDYLRRYLLLAAWTRAILLNRDDVALSLAPEVANIAPEMSSAFDAYLKAQTAKARRNAALYALLKFPALSPYVSGELNDNESTEELDYYLETAWWCLLPNTEYDGHGNEVAKVVPPPSFLTAEQLETARRERVAMRALGDAKSYLGKQVVEWAKSSPLDPRIPEALYIAVRANESYKYGCDSWAFDEETKTAAENLLRQRYAKSPWTAKLPDDEQ